jgi:hypothetical protein
MTKSTKQQELEQVQFSLANGMEATGSFNGGDISCFGGLGLLSLIDDANGYIAGAARMIKDRRCQDRVVHSMANLLRQVVLLTCAGYPDGIDSNVFRQDPMLKLCLGWSPEANQHAAAQATISRLMNTCSKRELMLLFGYFLSFYIKKHKKAPKTIALDFDGSAIEAHGRQQYIAFNGHYEINMYFPLFVFDDSGWLIAPILRPGNVSDAGIALDVLKIICKRLKRAWPGVKILFRGDAAFHSPKIMDWCEANAVDFVVGLKGDNALNSKSKEYDNLAKREFEAKYGAQFFGEEVSASERHQVMRSISGEEKEMRRMVYALFDERQVRQLGEFRHQAGTGGNDKKRLAILWKKERRVISLARFTDRGLKRRYLATSLEGYTPAHIYDQIYSLRGKAEQNIRTIKSLGAARLNNQEALANQFKLLIEGLAYNLFQLLREQLPEALRNLSVETLIREVVRIAVQVKVSTRRIWLRWTSSHPLKNQILALCKRLNQLPAPA